MSYKYKSQIVFAKQLTSVRGLTHVITPKGQVHMAQDWDGKVEFTIKKLKSGVKVYDAKGKLVKEKPSKDETVS